MQTSLDEYMAFRLNWPLQFSIYNAWNGFNTDIVKF